MISFVYFDLGGVVIRDTTTNGKWEAIKREIGITVDNSEAFDKFWNRYEPPTVIGNADLDSLVPGLKQELKMPIPDDYSLLNAFISRLEVNQSIWPSIEYARQRCRIGLLTNMYPRMFAAIQNKGIMPNIEWDVIIDSTIVGAKKPDKKMFQVAQDKAEVKPEEILFVDNSPGNTEAAKSFGWETFLYESTNLEFSSDQLLVYLSDKLGALKDHAGN